MAAAETRNVVIIGSGPAGYTAALYAARADLQPLVYEGYQPGGQLTITTDVENYPGFPEGIMGPEMMTRFKDQAARFGAEIRSQNVEQVALTGGSPFRIKTHKEEVETLAVIIATGATAKLLGLPDEDRFMGHGLSACATCDGFFFKGKKVLVVGGGDSALEEAIFLTRFCTQVTLVHRRDELRASKIMRERALATDKLDFMWNSTIDAYLGQPGERLEGVKIKDTVSEEVREHTTDGVFLGIGHVPNTDLFKGQLAMEESGYLITRPDRTATEIEGVFACGDVQDSYYRQAVTAAGSGCAAAIEAERWLESRGH